MPCCEHQLINRQMLIAHLYGTDCAVGVMDTGDGFSQQKGAAPARLQMGEQLLAEPMAIADLLAGGIDAADKR